jgi:hypothetical protein
MVGAKLSVSDLTATTLSANEMKKMDVSRILIYLGFNAQLSPLCPVGASSNCFSPFWFADFALSSLRLSI